MVYSTNVIDCSCIIHCGIRDVKSFMAPYLALEGEKIVNWGFRLEPIGSCQCEFNEYSIHALQHPSLVG